jgi:adenosylcobinamide kinase / adenosylcobinamide-phosphate guanylyltransferase
MLTLILGGARSGKSRFAQSLCGTSSRVAYLATGLPQDEEMRARIARHRSDRPSAWTTLEEPLEISSLVNQQARSFDMILLDCLTLWLSNWCWEYRNRTIEQIEASVVSEIERLSQASLKVDLIAVSNEVGCSIVPESSIGRQFRDLQGMVNQQVASVAQTVYQMVAGIPVLIKTSDTPAVRFQR